MLYFNLLGAERGGRINKSHFKPGSEPSAIIWVNNFQSH